LGLRIVKALNIVLMTLPFVACWFFYYAQRIAAPYNQLGNWAVVGLFVLLYVIFARIYDGFLVSVNRISEMIYSQGLAVLISDGVLFVVIWLLSRRFPNLLPGLAALAAQILLAGVWSTAAHKWYYASFPAKKSAIIYGRRFGMEKLIREYGLEKKFDIRLTVSVEDCLQDPSVLLDMDTVFISGVSSHDRNVILKHCVANGVDAYVLPRIGDIIMSGAKKMHMFHLPVLQVGRCNPHPEQTFVKRLFDIAVSAAVLLVASPVMIITAVAIKATDGGPVFYKQTRLTKDGKEFKVLKFRSMRVDAEKDGVARLSTGSKDNRITPVGRIIRKVRIDELPQLLNILGGSMSVVGPRPERPEIAAQYEEELPEFRLRLQVKAGLTGYAQVYGKYNTTPYDKLQMDLMYIANPSFLEDLRIIFATIKIIFIPESTDGIAEGQTTAAAASGEDAELVGVEK
jgi:exopolysaccharide biosynthesis polyprenyl glycosylphosphotransferase